MTWRALFAVPSVEASGSPAKGANGKDVPPSMQVLSGPLLGLFEVGTCDYIL
jgi:hypothetical protein